MGKETAEAPAATGDEEQNVVVEPTEPEEQPEGGAETEEEGEQQETPEVEVVLEGADGSQPDKQRGIRKRVNKLNKKVAAAEDTASSAVQELENEREKTKLLQLALEQKTPAETPPDPMDFDEGARDPKYVKALNDYNQPLIAAEVQRQTANLAPVQTDEVDPALVTKQTKHYERANELGAKDFEEVEDKAIGILGNDVANIIIRSFDKSELILYYLGTEKNQGKALDIAQLLKEDPVKGVAELGRMEARLSAKPKSKSEPTPDPDEELQGGSPSAGKTNKLQKELDAARESTQGGGDMSAIKAVKKRAKEAGVALN